MINKFFLLDFRYPEVCNSTISGTDLTNPQKYVQAAMKAAMVAVNESIYVVTDLQSNSPVQKGTQFSALATCKQVLGDALDQLNTSLYRVSDLKLSSVRSQVGDIQQFMSAALTYQDTCLDGVKMFGVYNGSNAVNGTQATHTTQLLSNALSLVNSLSKLADLNSLIPQHTRRLLMATSNPSIISENINTPYELVEDRDSGKEFPHWFTREGRRLLQTTRPTANAVVAQDGSGQYKTIQAAVNAAPTSGARWVIYVKKGTYTEQVNIPKNNKNLMMYGDGPGVTIITGSKSVIGSGLSTFYTATFGEFLVYLFVVNASLVVLSKSVINARNLL